MTEKNKVLVILPSDEIADFTFDRIEDLLSRYFPIETDSLTVTINGAVGDRYKKWFDGNVIAFDPAMFLTHNVIVLSEDLSSTIQVPAEKRIYALEHYRWRVLLHLRNQAIDERDWPAFNAHAFNKNGPKVGWDTHEYFPYGFVFRECAVAGPIDAFGFRIDEDLEALRHRPSSHKVIAFLGGSGTWSWYASYQETFEKRLEQRLREQLKTHYETVSVLNFGQGGSVLLHEIIVWMLHVERLRPEIVISHDGYNDLLFGMTTDPFLIRRDICAPHIFELWGQKLHDRSDVEQRFSHGQPVSVVNFPRHIIQAFIARKTQLDRLVRASGSQHIAALQPYANSKKLSDLEEEQVEQQRYRWIWGEAQRHIPELFRQASEALAATDLRVLNLHEYFSRFGSGETLFQDFMHTTPAGDERLAEAYFDYIVENELL